jgi:uncharacterized alkaline shock family protein YloU
MKLLYDDIDEGGIFMIGRLDTGYGEVTIDNEVLEKVAGVTAVECYGIVGMAMVNVTSGIAKLLKGDSITKGISLKVDDNCIRIDLHIVIEYGVNIKAVTDNLVSTVKYKLETFSGLEVKHINIYVEDVRVDE